MSWGYFLDLRLNVASDAWALLMKEKPAALDVGFFGLEETMLEEAFLRPSRTNDNFEKVLAWPNYHCESVHQVEDDGEATNVRILVMLDKSLLDLAAPLASLFDRARAHGASGRLALVNDGTSGGEFGVELALEDGEITRARIPDESWDILEALGGELFGAAAPTKNGMINPFTGEPVPPPAKKKTAKKKTAKKK